MQVEAAVAAAVAMASVRALRAQLEDNLNEQRSLRAQEAELRDQIAALEAVEAAEAAEAAAAASSSSGGGAAAVGSDATTFDWSGAFPWDAAVLDVLASRFGHASFRPLQREVINATLKGKDVFAVLPTGAGKSLIFQLPGLLAPHGLTVVVSPLVSLMTDQVHNLQSKGIRAALLASDVTSREQTTAIQQEAADPVSSGLRFLYVTPERVAKSKQLLAKLQKAYLASKLSRIAIDEAHCAAAQGHDFRPVRTRDANLRPSPLASSVTCLWLRGMRSSPNTLAGLPGPRHAPCVLPRDAHPRPHRHRLRRGARRRRAQPRPRDAPRRRLPRPL